MSKPKLSREAMYQIIRAPVITEKAPLSPGASQATAARRGAVMSARTIAISPRSRPGGRRPPASWPSCGGTGWRSRC